MKTVKIINGTYGYHPRPKVVEPVEAGGTCVVSDDEAARLVMLKVAVVVDNAAPEMTATPVATTENGKNGGEASNDLPDGGNNEEDDGDGEMHLDVDDLMKMTREDMEILAADMGVDIAGAKNKTEIAERIAAVPVSIDDEAEHELPSLAPEAPVS